MNGVARGVKEGRKVQKLLLRRAVVVILEVFLQRGECRARHVNDKCCEPAPLPAEHRDILHANPPFTLSDYNKHGI